MNQRNEDVILSAFEPSARLLARPVFSFAFSQAEENGLAVTFNNMDYSILSQTESDAIVYAGGTLTVATSQDNSQVDSDFGLDVPVTLKDNRWYVTLDLQALYKFLQVEYGY